MRMFLLPFTMAFWCALMPTLTIHAQNPDFKQAWGVVSPADLRMKYYDKDSAATSVVLMDVGELEVSLSNSGATCFVTRHKRIKILDPSALDKGNLIIPYLSYKRTEKITDLDVQVIFPNGEIQKVASDNIFTEKINKYRTHRKVFIPNLQKGCIIEYKMEVRSDDIVFLRAWDFQDDIPVRYSELNMIYPQDFHYVPVLKNPYNRVQAAPKKTLKAKSKIQETYYEEHAPAVREEPFISSLADYTDRIDFYLSSYHDSRQELHKVLPFNWVELAEKALSIDAFSDAFKANSKKNKEFWEAFLASNTIQNDSALAVAEKAVRFTSKQIEWNGEFDIFPDHMPNELLALKTGSSSELNLSLLALLKRADLDAYPVLVSTVDHGVAQSEYPVLDGFNSVVVLLKDKGKLHLLDATSPFLKLGHLMPHHYNVEGWVVDKEASEWLNFTPSETMDVWYVELNLDEAGNGSGKFSVMADGYEAVEWRKRLSKGTAEDFIKNTFFSKIEGLRVDSIEVSNQTDFSKPIKLTFNAFLPEIAQVANDLIYFSPVLHTAFDENPFKATQRQLPITFVFPMRQDYIINVHLPKGYQPDELPKGERTQIPNNGGKVMVNCSLVSPEVVQVVIKNKLSGSDFDPAAYQGIKHFFDAMKKNDEIQLAFKKQ